MVAAALIAWFQALLVDVELRGPEGREAAAAAGSMTGGDARSVGRSCADPFVDGAYATVKGRVRTFVLHQQLLGHLPAPPATVLDVGGGAGHQSLPLARLGYDVTILDPSRRCWPRPSSGWPGSRTRSAAGPAGRGGGRGRREATDGRRFAACSATASSCTCRDRPDLEAMCRCVEPGGVVSVMALNAATMAVRPALEHRWADALAAFDADERDRRARRAHARRHVSIYRS